MKLRQNMLDTLQCRNKGPFIPTCELAFFQLDKFYEDSNPPALEAITEAGGDKRVLRQYCSNIAEALERLEHGMICLWNSDNIIFEIAETLADISEGRFAVAIYGDETLGIPEGSNLAELCFRLADEPDAILAECDQRVEEAIVRGRAAVDHGVDVIWMCADYCFNDGPFLSPEMFARFVTPFLKRQIAAFRDLGLITIKHTDGDIMPIIDQIFECQPHALHSIDAQAGVDIAEVRELAEPPEIALIGNVEHQYMEIGTENDLRRSCRYCLEHGGAGKAGYIYSTSNAINQHSRMDRYLLMQQIRHEKMCELGYNGPSYPTQPFRQQ